MSRDPESVYRVKPDIEMPLFEQDYGVARGQVRTDAVAEKSLPIAHARRTYPRTSKQAAASVNGITQTQNWVLRIFREFGPMTDERLIRIFERSAWLPKVSPSGLRSRRSELVRMGLVVDSGQVGKTASGNQSIIWKVKKMKRPRGRTLGIAAMARKLGISRQRLWQIMQNEQGLCRLCSLRAVSSGLCEKHFIERRLYHRKRNGNKPKRAGRPGRYPKTFSKAGGR